MTEAMQWVYLRALRRSWSIKASVDSDGICVVILGLIPTDYTEIVYLREVK